MFLELAALVTTILLAGYAFIKNRHRYWLVRNVPYLRPKNLLLGNSSDVFLGSTPLYEYHANMYHQFHPSDKYGGYFNFLNPTLIIRDTELIRRVLAKDFGYFVNRNSNVVLDEKEPLSLHLFNLTGERWRILRQKLTPTFTSGKIKIMFTLMKECSEELVDVIDKLLLDKKDESFEMKDIMARFTTDVISTCAFGLHANSLKNPDSIFRVMGKKLFEFSFKNRVIGFISAGFPGLRRLLGLSFFNEDVRQFFESTVKSTIKSREEGDVQRNDFIDLLVALKKEAGNNDEKKFELTDSLIIAQCFVFFVAGFETSSSTLTFALFELAKHQGIQDKLLEEIDDVLKETRGEVTYESLHAMKYLDQVVSETLRLYPILPFLVRICNQPYQLDENYTIEVGTRVIIPVLGLHSDERYYPNPGEFNPENFRKEVILERDHYCYLPFGEGPRACIGMRFGLTQVKLGLVELLKHYRVDLAPNMERTLKFKKSSFLPYPESGIYLTFDRRSNVFSSSE